jgi:hypothetical protein
MENYYELAKELTAKLKKKAPGYWVSWNPTLLLMPDDPASGCFEIFGTDGKVHYRRRTYKEVLQLI